MKRLLQGLVLGLLLGTLSLSAKSQILTIDKAIELALKHSPDIDISRFDFKGAIERTKFQEGYYLPRLDLTALAGASGRDFKQQENLDGTTLLGNLSASQLIYDFGKTSGRIDASNAEANALEATIRSQ